MSDGRAHGERLEWDARAWASVQAPAAVTPEAWDAASAAYVAREERQKQREHELAMARLDTCAQVIEARVRLEHAWTSLHVVQACAGAFLAGVVAMFGFGLAVLS